MLTRSFYFLRHGETDWNKQSLLQGSTDIPLNMTGQQQAETVASRMALLGIDRIVCSHLQRAHKTAEIINAVLNKPLTIDPDLRERGFGAFEGKCYTEMDRIRHEMAARGDFIEENGYACPPEAESYADFKTRVIAVFNKYLNQFANENVLFVTHGGVYRVLTRCLLQQHTHSPNTQPFFFERHGEGLWTLHEK